MYCPNSVVYAHTHIGVDFVWMFFLGLVIDDIDSALQTY